MKLDQNVMDTLRAAQIDGLNVRLMGQLDRKLYAAVNEVLEAIGGKWNRKLKAHVFASDPREAIERAIADEEIETEKDLNFYPTPADVVEQMIIMADVWQGHSVLEPSAGTGEIALPCKAITDDVDVIELSQARRDKLAKAGLNVIGEDFLTFNSSRKYDRILMNPPFEKGIEIDHVNHALSMLKDDGVLVAVLPPALKYRQQKKFKALRERVETGDNYVIDLAEGTFAEAGPGTQIKTCVVVIYGGDGVFRLSTKAA